MKGSSSPQGRAAVDNRAAVGARASGASTVLPSTAPVAAEAQAGTDALAQGAEGRAVPPGRARQIITVGLVMAMAVVAMEQTVVVTALPTIVGEFDRLDLFPWVFSAYLLTSTVSVPLYGKLADILGRRRVFLFGIVLFLAGSMLCGFAQSMTQLIVFRALQGLGAGAVAPSIFTLIADLYRLQERAKVQGVFSTLWGVASLVGPGLGAWLTLTWSWRSVFFVSVPFGVIAAVFFVCFFKERVEKREVSLDIAGSVLLMGGLTLLLLALTQGSEGLGWASPVVLALLGASVLMLVGFVVAERRAPDPVLPLSLFELRVMSVSSSANFLSGAVLFGVTSYVPLFVQGALGEGPAGAGAALTPMLVTWSMSGFVGPRLLLRFGFRATAVGATLLIALGSGGLVLVSLGAPQSVLYASMAILGFGFGPSTAAFMMVLQEAVPWSMRGVATSSTQLFRSLGGTLGVALLGSILHVGLTSRIEAAGLDPSAVGSLLAASGEAVSVAEAGLRTAMAGALQPVFVVSLGIALGTLLVALVFARDEKLTHRA